MGRPELHASDKTETRLHVEDLAEDLFTHTDRIMRNKKYFNPEQDFNQMTLFNLYDTVLQIQMLVHDANLIDMKKDGIEKAQERLQLQWWAFAAIERMLVLEKDARRIFTELARKKKKFHYWFNLTLRLRSATKAWRESDRKRFLELYPSAPEEDLAAPKGTAQNGCRLNFSLGG